MGLILGSGTTKPQYPYDQWYGVQGDFTSQDYLLTRVGNLDLHRTLPLQSKLRRFVENEDGSVKYYLGANDSRIKDSGAAADITGASGNVMLEIPEHYVRVEISGTKWIYAISEYPLPGFVKKERMAISPWFATYNQSTGKPQSGCFLTWDGNNVARGETGLPIFVANASQCRGGNNTSGWDDTYRSLVGMPRTNVAKSTVRGWCNTAANGIHHGAYRAYNTIAWFQRIEYASLHCQDTYTTTLTADGFHQGGLGSGCSVDGGQWNTHNGYNPFVPCGVTATLGNNTGKVTFTVKNWQNGGTDKDIQVTSYRGLETPYEYLWMLADDVLVHHSPDTEDAKSTIYLCTDPTKFTSHSDSATTVPEGYIAMTDLPRSSGYIKTNAFAGELGLSFPDKIGGDSNKGICDYFWHPGATASGWYGALLSAVASFGATAGFGFLDASYRSSDAFARIGFRLCRG